MTIITVYLMALKENDPHMRAEHASMWLNRQWAVQDEPLTAWVITAKTTCCLKEVTSAGDLACSTALCCPAILQTPATAKNDSGGHFIVQEALGLQLNESNGPLLNNLEILPQTDCHCWMWISWPEEGLKETDCLNQILMTHSLHAANTSATHEVDSHTQNMFPQHTHSHLCTPCSSALRISSHFVG